MAAFEHIANHSRGRSQHLEPAVVGEEFRTCNSLRCGWAILGEQVVRACYGYKRTMICPTPSDSRYNFFNASDAIDSRVSSHSSRIPYLAQLGRDQTQKGSPESIFHWQRPGAQGLFTWKTPLWQIPCT